MLNRNLDFTNLETNSNTIESWIEKMLDYDFVDGDFVKKVLNSENSDDCIYSFKLTFLSNFYACKVSYDNVEYQSVENGYLCQKFDLKDLDKRRETKDEKQQMDKLLEDLNEILRSKGCPYKLNNFSDIFTQKFVISALSKRISQKLTKLGHEKENRSENKLYVMIHLLWQKFSQNSDLKEKLLSTNGKYLLEGNDRGDVFRGACKTDESGEFLREGNNYLGKTLIIIRFILNGDIEIPQHLQK